MAETRKRTRHFRAVKDSDRIAAYCEGTASAPTPGKRPILTGSWWDVTCKYCVKAKFNGVPIVCKRIEWGNVSQG